MGSAARNDIGHWAQVLVVPLDQPTDPFHGQADSISSDGVFVRSNTLVPPHSACQLVVSRLGTTDPVCTRARVVHNIPGVGFGCVFTEIKPEMQSRLNRWLDETPDRIYRVSPAA